MDIPEPPRPPREGARLARVQERPYGPFQERLDARVGGEVAAHETHASVFGNAQGYWVRNIGQPVGGVWATDTSYDDKIRGVLYGMSRA